MDEYLDADNDSNWETVGLSDNDNNYNIEDIVLEEDDIKECKYFLKYEDTMDVDKTIFTPSDLDEMKMRERVMMERNDRGYYRCKVKDAQLYEQISAKYSRFIAPEMLKQLNHCWSTQKMRQ